MGEHLVITIARQYGSNGREIGIRVAELLGINFYDKELITMASQKTGISADVINNIDEKATNSLLYTLALSSSSHGDISAGFNMPVNDKLFVAQSEIIRELANENDCVIIGRCGDYVLRSHKRLVSIFIYADLETRIKRIMERHNISYDEAKERVAKTDKRRINYYNFYTGRKWGKYDHYNLSLNSGMLGVEATAQLIANMVRSMPENDEA